MVARASGDFVICYYDPFTGDYITDPWDDPPNTRLSDLLRDENQFTVQLDEEATTPDIHIDSNEPVGEKRKRKDVDLPTCGPSTSTHDILGSRGSEEVAQDNNNSTAPSQNDAKRPCLDSHFPQHDTSLQDHSLNTSATSGTSRAPKQG
ncbi:hypothetical protein FIE12Z_11588 [Fusarium flagelliforme]|uniref:Uncharacterized protein n=1 Tax=Fusarium flagelliforme TaxID=2675880 RepID=A0A395M8M0_9HYPO|nr:hypothetical protein FIE12Z_11588 [Fusarium flagelliforme]